MSNSRSRLDFGKVNAAAVATAVLDRLKHSCSTVAAQTNVSNPDCQCLYQLLQLLRNGFTVLVVDIQSDIVDEATNYRL